MDNVENSMIIESEVDVLGILNSSVIPGLKHLDDKNKQHKKREDETLFNATYKKSVKQANELKPHADADYYPHELFKDLNPHRREDESRWLKENYEPYTLPIFIDFMNTIKRGVNENNYSINWPENQEDLKKYCLQDLPTYENIQSWFKDVLFDLKIKDANGVFAVRPKTIPYVISDDGVPIVDDQQKLEPIPVFYDSSKSLFYIENQLFIGLSDEKSKVIEGNKSVMTGFVVYIYTPNVIYKMTQINKRVDYDFEITEWFVHDWGYLSAWKAKGLPRLIDSNIYYQSPLYFAKAPLNTALKNKMVLEMAGTNTAFPIRIMMTTICDYVDNLSGAECVNGKLTLEGEIKSPCPSCHGRGIKDNPSAGGTIIVNEELVGDSSNPMDRVRYASPSVDILKWMDEKCRSEENSARSILHLKNSMDQATGDISATGRQLDMNSTYAFMMPILSQGFDIFENVITSIAYYREAYDEFIKINRPVDIDYKTSNDYLADYKAAVEAGSPPIVILGFLEKYIKSLFYASKNDEAVWKLVLAVDSLVAQSNDEVRQLIGSGIIQKWQAVLHVSIFSYIDRLINEVPNFLELDLNDQKARIEALAKADAAASQNNNRTQLADNIILNGGV